MNRTDRQMDFGRPWAGLVLVLLSGALLAAQPGPQVQSLPGLKTGSPQVRPTGNGCPPADAQGSCNCKVILETGPTSPCVDCAGGTCIDLKVKVICPEGSCEYVVDVCASDLYSLTFVSCYGQDICMTPGTASNCGGVTFGNIGKAYNSCKCVKFSCCQS